MDFDMDFERLKEWVAARRPPFPSADHAIRGIEEFQLPPPADMFAYITAAVKVFVETEKFDDEEWGVFHVIRMENWLPMLAQFPPEYQELFRRMMMAKFKKDENFFIDPPCDSTL